MTILEEIERDLRAFADPGATVVVAKDSAVWEQNGREMTARFTTGTDAHDYPDVTVEGRRLSYRSFLASPGMADLGRLAEFITKTDRSRGEGFIETAAKLIDEDAEQAPELSATQLIMKLATEDLPFLSTRVLLVSGEAGSGKTIALRELTSRQAERFRIGESKSLFFYVDAQGRALSRLEDAMAKDLQDLRSSFSYAAIAPLTRHQLIVPIIDGFDELLGSGGYDEAFSSLAAFLSTLEGKGSVVASARSSFFDYRNFRENATRFSGDGRLNYTVDTVTVLPWSRDFVRKYVGAVAPHYNKVAAELVSTLDRLEESLDPANRSLLSKPFYTAKVAELLGEDIELTTGEDLLQQLVTAFLDREHKKQIDRQGQPLLSAKGHHAFLTALAEEMWWQESSRVDVGTVQAVAELVSESFGLPPGTAKALAEKVSSYAFLSTDQKETRFLRFEHQVFYGYFLAHKLQQYIEREPSDLRRFLGRSVLDETLADQAVRLIGNDAERCTRAIEGICNVLRASVSEVVSRENAGVLISSIMRSAHALRDEVTIRNVVFRQVSLGSVELRRPRFEHCDFSQVDFRNARLSSPEFINTPLREIEVDTKSTRLEGADPSILDSVFGLVVHSSDPKIRSGRVYDPDEVAAVLYRLGVAAPVEARQPKTHSSVVEERLDVLDRFLRKMERRFYASEEDVNRFPFANGRAWEAVRGLLIKHGLLEKHFISKSGPREPLLRLGVPPDLIRRGENTTDQTVPVSIRSFWADLTRE